MKYLFTLFIVAAVSSHSFGQSTKAKEVQLELKGDTLIVPYYPLYKFIKLGDRVYKINPPTLTEEQEMPLFRGGMILDGGITVPTYERTFIQSDSVPKKKIQKHDRP